MTSTHTHAFAEAEDAVHQHDGRDGSVEHHRGLVLALDGDALGHAAAGHKGLVHEGGGDVGDDGGAEDVEGVAQVDDRAEEQLRGAQRGQQRRPRPAPHAVQGSRCALSRRRRAAALRWR